jgi:hypothetical protein
MYVILKIPLYEKDKVYFYCFWTFLVAIWMQDAKGWGSVAYISLDACSEHCELLKIVLGIDYLFCE